MKVLLIGGAGFIGSKTALRLLEKGHEPFVLDSLDPQVHGENAAESPRYQRLSHEMEMLHADARDAQAVGRAIAKADAIYYLPAATGTGQSMYQIERYCDVNARAAGIFAECLARQGSRTQRIIVSSTRAVYGEGAAVCACHGRVFPDARCESDLKDGRFETVCPHCRVVGAPAASLESDPARPGSIYGITKLAQEQIIANTARNLGISCVVFRYQNVYGPGQSLRNPYTGILTIFSQLALAGRPINLFEDGKPTRDFIHLDDVVEYNVRALDAPISEATLILNVGRGERVTLIDLAEALGGALGLPTTRIVSGEYRAGDIRHAAADLSKLRHWLGQHSCISLPDGLRSLISWMAEEQAVDGWNERFDRSLDEMRAAGLLRTATK